MDVKKNPEAGCWLPSFVRLSEFCNRNPFHVFCFQNDVFMLNFCFIEYLPDFPVSGFVIIFIRKMTKCLDSVTEWIIPDVGIFQVACVNAVGIRPYIKEVPEFFTGLCKR